MPNKENNPIKFAAWFVGLFLGFYYFNLFYFGLTNPGGFYSSFCQAHLNYIAGLRWLLLKSSACLLKVLNFNAITNDFELLVAGRGRVRLVYSCLGLGLLSFFAAFVLAYPKTFKARMIFLLSGIVIIELLNVLRFVLLVLFWNKRDTRIADHHTIFNILIYLIVSISLYFWVKQDFSATKPNAKNRS